MEKEKGTLNCFHVAVVGSSVSPRGMLIPLMKKLHRKDSPRLTLRQSTPVTTTSPMGTLSRGAWKVSRFGVSNRSVPGFMAEREARFHRVNVRRLGKLNIPSWSLNPDRSRLSSWGPIRDWLRSMTSCLFIRCDPMLRSTN